MGGSLGTHGAERTCSPPYSGETAIDEFARWVIALANLMAMRIGRSPGTVLPDVRSNRQDVVTVFWEHPTASLFSWVAPLRGLPGVHGEYLVSMRQPARGPWALARPCTPPQDPNGVQWPRPRSALVLGSLKLLS